MEGENPEHPNRFRHTLRRDLEDVVHERGRKQEKKYSRQDSSSGLREHGCKNDLLDALGSAGRSIGDEANGRAESEVEHPRAATAQARRAVRSGRS